MENTMRMVDARNRGYTLIEILTVIGIIAVVTAGGFGIYGVLRGADFDSQTQALLDDLRDMQTRAITVEDDKQYGVAFASSSWTTKFRSADTGAATDIETTELDGVTLDADLEPSAAELYFARLTGKPVDDTNAVLTLTLVETGQTKEIRVEDTGVLYAE